MNGVLLTFDHFALALPGPQGLVDVLVDVSLEAHQGEIVGIAGESGSGKSMTGRALLGIISDRAHTSGRIAFAGQDLLSMTKAKRRALRGTDLAMVFQDPTSTLHPMLTIERQLTEHMDLSKVGGKKGARERAVALLDEVRIPDPERALRSYPHQFSGGMRQRIAIAMALAGDPRVIVADEPTTALDVTVQAGILRLFRRLADERGLTVLFITHDLGVLAALADRTYIFYGGRVVEGGTTSELIASPGHPYTTALLGARPEVNDDGSTPELTPIKGLPVNAASAPAGCPFHPRCPVKVEVCTHVVPKLLPIRGEQSSPHIVACHVRQSRESEKEVVGA